MYRDLIEDEVTFRLNSEQDDTEVRGNAIVSGDDDFDKQVENEILDRLDRGDVWAWALVTVTAIDPKTGLEGHDYLGGCSYKDKEDFMQVSGYYDEMKQAALDDLNRERYRLWKGLSRDDE